MYREWVKWYRCKCYKESRWVECWWVFTDGRPLPLVGGKIQTHGLNKEYLQLVLEHQTFARCHRNVASRTVDSDRRMKFTSKILHVLGDVNTLGEVHRNSETKHRWQFWFALSRYKTFPKGKCSGLATFQLMVRSRDIEWNFVPNTIRTILRERSVYFPEFHESRRP